MDIDNYTYDFEERKYINPETSRNEQQDFINTFRDIQSQNNAEINQQTHNLGRDIPSNLGGLTGSEGYFQSRYQTPQVNAIVSNLDAAAQASALNQVLNNLQSQYKQRYTKAQQAYQSRANSGSTTGGYDSDENQLQFSTDTGAQDQITVDDNAPTGNNTIKSVGVYDGKVLQEYTANDGQRYNVVAATNTPLWAAMSGGGTELGVWPNGRPITEGSMYNYGGGTYLYATPQGFATPQLYQVISDGAR